MAVVGGGVLCKGCCCVVVAIGVAAVDVEFAIVVVAVRCVLMVEDVTVVVCWVVLPLWLAC